ncbi:MAG: TonB-dependent receptor domain-containing protein [Candidatus Baltobacteraceae bacterium]
MGLFRRHAAGLRAVFSVLLAVTFVIGGQGAAFAGTTGIINGVVTDQQTKAPISGVRVTAAAPSGSYTATTDQHGFYSMTGVYPDSYTVSFQAGSYAPVVQPGVAVFADLTATASASMTKELRTIAKVTSRSAGGAFQPNQTVDTYTVTAAQANQILGNNINLSESQLIASLPGASFDSSGYPVIRGGRENEESFQFEGIPYTDAFTNQFVNTLSLPGLGLQSAQLTPGVSNATFASQGTGALNLIVKRGTYPGFATGQLAVGEPSFRHSANFEWGWATPDGHWSNYMSFAGRNLAPQYRYNSLDIGRFGSTQMESDREFINNLVYRFGKNNGQSLQVFADVADHHFYEGYGGYGATCFASCDPAFLRNASAFTGIDFPNCYGTSNTAGSIAGNGATNCADILSIVPLDPYQRSASETLAQANRNYETYYQPNASYKLQYTNNLNSSTYLSVMAYKTNAVVIFDFPEGSGTNPFGFNSHLQQGGQTTGGKIDLTKQLSEKHVLKLGGNFAWLHPVYDQPWTTFGFWNGVFGNGEVYDFLSPAQGGTGYLAANGIPAGTRMPPSYESANSNRQDFGVYLNDTWTPNARLNVDIGVRMDGTNQKFNFPVGMNANCEFYYLPTSITAPADPSGIRTPGDCGTATFDVGNNKLRPRVVQPVMAVSWKLGNNDAVRAAYGRSVEFPTLGAEDLSAARNYYSRYNNVPSYSAYSNAPAANCGIFLDTLCSSYADELYWDNQNDILGVPIQPIKPEVFTNYDVSYSHQFTNGFLNGVQFKITPWLRNAQDAFAAAQTPKVVNGKIVTDPATGAILYNPPTQSNLGYSRADGIELSITRQVAYGLSGQFSATYQNEVSNVVPLSGSEDFYPSVPAASLALGNKYRVGFLSPFQTTLALDYHTHNGWRFSPQFFYNIGYPYGSGLMGASFVDGVAYNIPNTNYSAGLIGAPAGAPQYIDPMNPGTVFDPNIVASRGTPEKASPGGELTHPSTNINFTTEYELPNHQMTFGATILDVTNELFSGPSLNGRYQPVATGISGPLSGSSANTKLYGPAYGLVNYSSLRQPFAPYINTPNGAGRTFYFYVTTKI